MLLRINQKKEEEREERIEVEGQQKKENLWKEKKTIEEFFDRLFCVSRSNSHEKVKCPLPFLFYSIQFSS